ncbi:MAG: hypothetical protein Q8N53_04725 [Longimicrobiales bacterium]|nr:hypothetical protein [Longimicrobiales bacterium]
MHHTWKGIRKALGAPMAALMLLMGVTGPLLDSADLGAGTVIEGEHNPSSCAPSHDHSACIQVGANHALTPSADVRILISPVRVVPALGVVTAGRSPVLAGGHPTRGPPSA